MNLQSQIMNLEELLSRAWKAVEKSGVPESLHEVAFKEALDELRGEARGDVAEQTRTERARRGTGKKTGAKRQSATKKASAADGAPSIPDDDEFFTRLADESGVEEQDLRDILQLTRQGEVRVTSPTRRLGDTVADQAKSVIALVAGARAHGLNERPVNARAVRTEASRKNCYQQNNFASGHLGPMRGFNAGGRDEIVLTSRWVAEFKAAVDRAHGRSATDETS
jgi:hypothetical protein